MIWELVNLWKFYYQCSSLETYKFTFLITTFMFQLNKLTFLKTQVKEICFCKITFCHLTLCFLFSVLWLLHSWLRPFYNPYDLQFWLSFSLLFLHWGAFHLRQGQHHLLTQRKACLSGWKIVSQQSMQDHLEEFLSPMAK